MVLRYTCFLIRLHLISDQLRFNYTTSVYMNKIEMILYIHLISYTSRQFLVSFIFATHL